MPGDHGAGLHRFRRCRGRIRSRLGGNAKISQAIDSAAVVALADLHTRGGTNVVGLITPSAVLTLAVGLAAQNGLTPSLAR